MRRKYKKSRFMLIKSLNFNLKQRFFAFFVILIVLVGFYIKFLAVPIVIANTEVQIRSYATKSINYAIADSMNQNVSYGDLIKLIKDENGNVSYIEANSVRINLLSKTMSKIVMANFIEFSKLPIKIAIGSFSGISMLSGLGPKIAFWVNPYSEVNCYFNSKFEAAGINQTFHKLYLIIKITINVVFPFQSLQIDSSAEVLLSESLIVGKIPEVYLNSDKLNEMINLIPDSFNS